MRQTRKQKRAELLQVAETMMLLEEFLDWEEQVARRI